MNLPQHSVGSSVSKALVSGAPPVKLLANGRPSWVDQLKAQPRKPGEASFFYADHHFQYDVRDGANHFPQNVYPKDMPALNAQLKPLKTYAVEVKDGEVWVNVDE